MLNSHKNSSPHGSGVNALLLVVAATALSFVDALPSYGNAVSKTTHVVRDSLPEVPNGYDYLYRAPSHYTIPVLRIGLAQSNFHLLEKTLYSISDPSLPSYGAYLSHDQVEGFVRPSEESTVSVHTWLSEHGFTKGSWKMNSAGDWWTLENVPVHKAEKMLNCKFAVFVHRESGLTTVRTLEYGIPLHLDEHIDVIQPTTMFASPTPMHSTVSIQDGKISPDCRNTTTPQCLKDFYGTSDYVPSSMVNNSIATTGYLEQYFNYTDLLQFFDEYLPGAATSNYSLPIVSINNGINNESHPGLEATLDVQYISSLAFPIRNTFYSIAGRAPYDPDLLSPTENFNEPYALFTDYLLSLSKDESLPYVVSTSYDDDEQTVPKSYAVRVCNSFAQLGARGVSLLFSSGDGGVGGCATSTRDGKAECISNDGKNTRKFLPTFPASCPYVTGVGGTTLKMPSVFNDTGHWLEKEEEVGVGFSSGGFSEYFDVPAYQEDATFGYLEKLGEKYEGLYNPKGRGIPDIAALGENFHTIQGGNNTLVSGTSASCPTVASIIALLNDHRLRNGQPVMGFLNPWLYSVGFKGLNDIVRGNNPGCGTSGFDASEGWDPITGLGTPNFPELKDLTCH